MFFLGGLDPLKASVGPSEPPRAACACTPGPLLSGEEGGDSALEETRKTEALPRAESRGWERRERGRSGPQLVRSQTPARVGREPAPPAPLGLCGRSRRGEPSNGGHPKQQWPVSHPSALAFQGPSGLQKQLRISLLEPAPPLGENQSPNLESQTVPTPRSRGTGLAGFLNDEARSRGGPAPRPTAAPPSRSL